MFGISTSSLIGDVAQTGLAALSGGASAAIEMAATSVIRSAVGEGLQVLGQELGLPQTVIDQVKSEAGFATGSGAADTAASAGSQMGCTPLEQGQLAQTAQGATDAITQMMQQGVAEASQGAEKSGASHGKSGMSVLQAIAYAMGSVMDSKLDDMASKAQQLGSSQSGSSQYGQLSSEIQADGQELSMLSSAVANAIKSIGDAGSQLAKKD